MPQIQETASNITNSDKKDSRSDKLNLPGAFSDKITPAFDFTREAVILFKTPVLKKTFVDIQRTTNKLWCT